MFSQFFLRVVYCRNKYWTCFLDTERNLKVTHLEIVLRRNKYWMWRPFTIRPLHKICNWHITNVCGVLAVHAQFDHITKYVSDTSRKPIVGLDETETARIVFSLLQNLNFWSCQLWTENHYRIRTHITPISKTNCLFWIKLKRIHLLTLVDPLSRYSLISVSVWVLMLLDF